MLCCTEKTGKEISFLGIHSFITTLLIEFDITLALDAWLVKVINFLVNVAGISVIPESIKHFPSIVTRYMG